MASAVRDLELDLDAFEGPFDLLLTLVLKDQLEPAEIDIAAIVVAFVERLTARDELDLDACGEFLVLIAALLELKARHLFPDEDAELAELEPEEAAEELARRLAEYRRMKEAAAWLRERLAEERERYFRLGPAPLAPRAERRLAPQEPVALAEALRGLAVEPPKVSLSHMALRFPPVAQFLERFRAVLRRRRVFDFDGEVAGLSRVEQAVAFLALLELRRPARSRSRRPPRSRRSASPVPRQERISAVDRPLRLISDRHDRRTPIDALARTVEALLVVASQPLTVDELVEATEDDAERIETALGLLRERYARAAAGSCWSTSPAATRSARRARPPRRAGACSSGPSSAASRRRRSRRSRSSPTSGRSRAPRSRGSAASPRTRPSRRSSSAGSSPRPAARAGPAAPCATA